MDSKQKTAIILGVLGLLGGGGALVAIDMSTNIDNSRVDIRGDSNTVVNVDGEGLTCKELRDACQDINLEGVLKSACQGLRIICPGS